MENQIDFRAEFALTVLLLSGCCLFVYLFFARQFIHGLEQVTLADLVGRFFSGRVSGAFGRCAGAL